MFDLDDLREIWSTMKKNKLRTFLTGFSVAWGIFMLIILLAAGNGLRNGIAANFDSWSLNMMDVWPRYTTMPHDGLPSNRRIKFTENDVTLMKRSMPEIDLISAVNYREDTISFGKEYLTTSIQSVYPQFSRIKNIKILPDKGRFLNEPDMQEKKKVIVITPRIAKILFRDSVAPLGQYVKIGHSMFKVIGIYKEDEQDNSNPAYIPFSSGQQLFERELRVGDIYFTANGLNTGEDTKAFEERLRGLLARSHRFDPKDRTAVGFFDIGEQYRMWQGMNNGIALFIWIIGIGTLMAGIVGVSNIMMITVRERTREFGIRKAIGAKPFSILKMIIVESILVTAIFGYIGMISGIGLSETINYVMEAGQQAAADSGAGGGGSEGNTTIFRNPTVNLGVSVAATAVLIVAGVIAGFVPARKAIKITAIEAMREE